MRTETEKMNEFVSRAYCGILNLWLFVTREKNIQRTYLLKCACGMVGKLWKGFYMESLLARVLEK